MVPYIDKDSGSRKHMLNSRKTCSRPEHKAYFVRNHINHESTVEKLRQVAFQPLKGYIRNTH